MESSVGKEYTIRLNNDAIYLNASWPYKYSNTNLPKHAFKFINSGNIYWRIRINMFEWRFKHLGVEVVNYDVEYDPVFDDQLFNEQANLIIFDKLDFKKLQPLLADYDEKYLFPFVKNTEGVKKQYRQTNVTPPQIFEPETKESELEDKPQIKQVDEWKPFSQELAVEFDQATFFDGRLSFNAFVRQKQIGLLIENSFLKPEFDFIKKWFIRKFKSKHFRVKVQGEYCGSELRNLTAESQQIASINQSFIEDFKPIYIEEYLLNAETVAKQKFVRVQDIIKEDGLAKSIFQEGLDTETLLKALISLNKVRNQKELEFLSFHSKVEAGKVVFTKAPQPGFIFSFLNKSNRSFIWELLDSHATYCWRFDVGIPEDEVTELLFKDVSICEAGRMRFKQQFKERNESYLFKPIHHYLNQEHGFTKWKAEIDQFIDKA